METFIKIWIFINGVILFISSMIFASIEPDTDKWFSRFAMAIICFGIWLIVKTIENKKL